MDRRVERAAFVVARTVGVAAQLELALRAQRVGFRAAGRAQIGGECRASIPVGRVDRGCPASLAASGTVLAAASGLRSSPGEGAPAAVGAGSGRCGDRGGFRRLGASRYRLDWWLRLRALRVATAVRVPAMASASLSAPPRSVPARRDGPPRPRARSRLPARPRARVLRVARQRESTIACNPREPSSSATARRKRRPDGALVFATTTCYI